MEKPEQINDEKKFNSVSSSESEEEVKRETWSRKLDAMLSFLGYAVGLGNIWRFPYLCMRNGGGAFLIPFIFFLTCVGWPLYFLELSLGQFTGKSASYAWEVCPIFKGIGIGMVIVLGLTGYYYNMIITWTLFYLGNSFISPLPWRTCGNDWNSDKCITHRTNQSNNSTVANVYVNENITAVLNTSENTVLLNNITSSVDVTSSEEEFWQRKMLSITSGLDDIGGLPWHLAVCSLAAWFLIYLCLMKGIKSIGKVVYVTATLPYVLLTVLLIRGVTLPGSLDGVMFYISPDFQRLKDPQVWIEAAIQVFFSLGPGWGPMITMASYSKFNNNCYRDSILLTLASEGTSIYGGFVIFSILGFMAHKAHLPISEIVKSGPGLAFIAYPEAISQLPIPNFWAVLFFIMLLTVGMDSQFVHIESVITALVDTYTWVRKRRVYVAAIVCVLYYLSGLLICSQGGIYIFQLMDWYCAAFALPLFCLLECVIFGWIYGAERFSNNIRLMLNRSVPVFMRLCWTFVTPLILLTLLLFTLATYKQPTYGDYEYPSYTTVIGWILSLTPVVPVPLCAVIVVINSEGDNLIQKLQNVLKPSIYWGPNAKGMSEETGEEKMAGSFIQRLKINLIGNKV